MLRISAVREIRGSVRLPPSPDYVPLAAALALAARCPCAMAPVADTPLMLLWRERLAERFAVESNGDQWRLTPRDDITAAAWRLPYDRLPFADFIVFSALAGGTTVSFEQLPPLRLAHWTSLALRLRCRLEAEAADGRTLLRLARPPEGGLPADGVSADELHPFLGFAVGARQQVAFDVGYQVATPLRHLLPAFGWELAVRGTAERPRDPIARRILRMKGKPLTTAPGTFRVTADFSRPPAAQADITLPGDDVLGSLLIAAKSIVQRGNLVIENVPLESWATAMIQFVRKAGCAPGVQPAQTTSLGQVGMLTLQRYEPGGRRVECLPAWQYNRQLPAMVAVALFCEEESVFRRLEDLRRDEPDGVALLLAALSRIGAHHGEMPDGLVLRGADQYDGFDLTEALPAQVAGAAAVIALRCIGSSTVEDSLILERWPAFSSMLASICEQPT